MADVYTRIGYIKGATGATGAQGAKGNTGDAATIQVGSVTTVPYGQTANVTNSGTESAAIFDFQIPQGRPGEQVTDMQNLTIGAITTSAASFPVPAVGETGKVLWGKVVKWFSDMAALVATKFDTANVVNNLTTTSSGYALDARQGKVLNDAVTPVPLSPTFPSQSNYTISNVLARRIGKICILYMNVVPVTPYSSYGGAVGVAGLPIPAFGFTQVFPAWSISTSAGQNNLRLYVLTDGSIGFRNGEANATYDVYLVYALS